VEYYFNGTTPNYLDFEAARRGATRNQEQVIHLDGYKGVRCNITSSTNNFKIYDTLNDAKETTDLATSNSYFANLQQRMKDRVLQVRRPSSAAVRPYDAALVPPVSTSNLVTGLDYRAFEGEFPWVPDFTALNSVTNGSCTDVDLSVRSRQDNIGLLYAGYLDVPSDGTYTIYLTTDNRAFLRLHDASVIDADFAYTGGTEVSASINLKAGRHPLRLAYVHGTNGAPSLTLQWSGPGIPKQPIPNTTFLRQSAAANNPPTAFNDSASTQQNTPLEVNVLANDSPGSGPGPVRVVSVGLPSAGTAARNLDGQILYTPNAGFLGEDTLSYTITDGLSNATALVRIKVFFADGLIWFPFNQASGLTTEDAGGAFTGTLTGFTNDPVQWVAGKWNRALDFNGVSHVAISGFNGILGASNRTVAAWVKTTSAGSGATGQPVIAWGPSAAGKQWAFLVSDGHLRVEITSGYVEGTTLVNDGEWHHIACVYSNDVTSITNARLYVDGILETSFTLQASLAVDTASSGSVMIGSDLVSEQNRYFNGVIDEPRIYDRALSAAEIEALYSAANESAAAWHRRHFGGAPIVWMADDDGDGGGRLLEYAFGGQPWIANTAALTINGALAGNRLQVSFPRRVAGTSELTYSMQVSRDLAGWNQLTAALASAIPLAAKPDFELATFQTEATLAQESAQYVRVVATLP
jgi:hypothetical protein